ncbi:hypothetical protein PG990_015458 [Apiospora arundinis]
MPPEYLDCLSGTSVRRIFFQSGLASTHLLIIHSPPTSTLRVIFEAYSSKQTPIWSMAEAVRF